MEDDNAGAATTNGLAKDADALSSNNVASEMTIELADGHQGEDADVLEPESTRAPRITGDEFPSVSPIFNDQERLAEKIAEPEHPADDPEHAMLPNKKSELKHHTVTVEEVTDEEADEPLHGAATGESAVDVVDGELVKFDSLVEQDEVARNEASLGEVIEVAVDQLEDENAVGDVIEAPLNNVNDGSGVKQLDDESPLNGIDGDGAANELHDEDAMDELDDEDADAYGELEDDDIEVLSISSSGDFPMLPHVKAEAEVEEYDSGEASGESDSQVRQVSSCWYKIY